MKLPLATFAPHAEQSYRARLFCTPDTAQRFSFSQGVVCGKTIRLAAAQLSAFKAKLLDVPAAGEQLTAELELTGADGEETTRYAFAFALLTRVPAEQLSASLEAVVGRPLAALRVGKDWPEYQKLEVAIEGDLSATARGFIQDSVVYIVFGKAPRTAPPHQLQVTLRHDQSGLVSAPFTFELRLSSLQGFRNYAVGAGLLGCVALFALLLVLALPPRPVAPLGETPDATQKSIEDWNRSFAADSLSAIKTGEESFSTVGSQFGDAQVSLRSNLGLFLAPTVELIELPDELRLTL